MKPKKERKMHSRGLFPSPHSSSSSFLNAQPPLFPRGLARPTCFGFFPPFPPSSTAELNYRPPHPLPYLLPCRKFCAVTTQNTRLSVGGWGPSIPPRIVHSGPCLGATNLVGGRREGASQYQVPPPLSAFRGPLRSDSHNHQLGEHASHSLSLEVLRKSAFSHL